MCFLLHISKTGRTSIRIITMNKRQPLRSALRDNQGHQTIEMLFVCLYTTTRDAITATDVLLASARWRHTLLGNAHLWEFSVSSSTQLRRATPSSLSRRAPARHWHTHTHTHTHTHSLCLSEPLRQHSSHMPRDCITPSSTGRTANIGRKCTLKHVLGHWCNIQTMFVTLGWHVIPVCCRFDCLFDISEIFVQYC